jgi:hypothetical protein
VVSVPLRACVFSMVWNDIFWNVWPYGYVRQSGWLVVVLWVTWQFLGSMDRHLMQVESSLMSV